MFDDDDNDDDYDNDDSYSASVWKIK